MEVSDGLDEHGNKEEGDPADDAAAELRVDDRITVRIIVRDVNETACGAEGDGDVARGCCGCDRGDARSDLE